MSATVNVSNKRNRWHQASGRVVGVRMSDQLYTQVKELSDAWGLGVSAYLAWLIERAQDDRVLNVILKLQERDPR